MNEIAYIIKNTNENTISIYLGDKNLKENEFTIKFYDKTNCIDLFDLIYDLQFNYHYIIKFRIKEV